MSSSDFLFLSNSTAKITINTPASPSSSEERCRSKFDFSSTASSLDSPSASSDEPPLLQPCASRLISCLRAPCLKRQFSGHASPNGSNTPPSGAVSPNGSADYGSGSETNNVSSYSFASIKRVLAAPPKRHVHFDAAPPEAGITYSRDNYDRRPIECTRGGSSFDLSLPPRGMCPSYSGEADDERCGGEEVDDEGDEQCNKERIRGFARWARLKNGGTILGGATLRYTPAGKTHTEPSQTVASSSDNREPNACSVPIHGIRSFGGLAGSIGHDDEVHSIEQEAAPKGRRRTLLSEMDDMDDAPHASTADGNAADVEDEEHAAFRQAVYRALSMSPNATPMPSPSVRTRWECVSSYFDAVTSSESKTNVENAAKTSKTETHATSPEETRTPIVTSNSITQSEESYASEKADSSPLPSPSPLTGAAFKTSPPLSSDSIKASSSSPMSSRCSSADTFSSQTGRDAEVDEFERSFSKIAEHSLRIPAPLSATLHVHASPTEDSNVFIIHAGQNLDSTDAFEDHAISSSSTISGSGGDWVSSCATSPEMPSSDDLPETACVKASGHFSLDADKFSSSSDKTGTASSETAFFSSSSNNGSSSPPSRCAISNNLLSPARRAISRSAPASAVHSPCVQSADEADTDDSSPAKQLLAAPLLQRSNSCSRKSRLKQRRFASSGDSPADTDDNLLPRPIRRSTTGQRSKSMSGGVGLSIKKSNFSATSFRSEIEDEGALGGF